MRPDQGIESFGRKFAFRLARQTHGVGVRQVRIACGLVMFTYILTHFLNHAVGNLSFSAMERWMDVHRAVWRSWPCVIILYSAATTHLTLGLWALYQRRHFRFPRAELVQLLLGLSVPLWLNAHFAGVRLNGAIYGKAGTYAIAFVAYWVSRPYMEWVQFTLLLVAWSHACIGLYFWLRLKPLFTRSAPVLLVLAILIPVLALLGLIHGAREVIELAQGPTWVAQNIAPLRSTPSERVLIDAIIDWFPVGYVLLITLVFVARGVRALRERRAGLLEIRYPAQRVLVPPGLSVLEASLRFGIPHASVCGGRARCSTCRVRVLGDVKSAPAPTRREAFVLGRIGMSADPSIRLACELRPQADISVLPFLPASVGADFVRDRLRTSIGEERALVLMFVDMRGSTAFAEKRLPFDVLFVVNRFLSAVCEAVVSAGGAPNQFLGDGLLAIFGTTTDLKTASKQAIKACGLIDQKIDILSQELATELNGPIKFGIGVHCGDVIAGDVGSRDRATFTALGDPVNTAARLQDMTKALGCVAVISTAVFESAGLRPAVDKRSISVRGRDGEIAVYCIDDPSTLVAAEHILPDGGEAGGKRY
jgi:adenylate cyclase